MHQLNGTQLITMKTRSSAFAYLILSIGAGVVYPASTVSAAITNEMVAHFTFDSHYSNGVQNNVKATPVGIPSFKPGLVGSHALAFSSVNGKANYVTLGTPAELNFGGSTDFSVSLWVRFSVWDGNPAFIANKDWSGIGPPGWVIATTRPGGLVWNIRETDGIEAHYYGTAGQISDGQWHHIAVSFDRNAKASAYVDGVMVNQTDIGPGQPSINTSPGFATNVGQDGTGSNANATIEDGLIDDLAIWRRVITADEVKQIYEAGLKGQNLLNISAPPVVTEPPKITGISILKTDLTISWTNTVGAATLQRKKALTDASWLNVTTNSNQKATIPFDGQIAFFRIVVNP